MSDTAKPASIGVEELGRAVARTFASHDGQLVLAHLRATTRDRVLGPDATDGALRYLEGQRHLVAHLERLIHKGRTGEALRDVFAAELTPIQGDNQ